MAGRPDSDGDNLLEKCQRLHRVCAVRFLFLTPSSAMAGGTTHKLAERLLQCSCALWSPGCWRNARACLQSQLKQIQTLERAAKQSEDQRTAFEDVTLQVKRLWDTLCDDITLLAQHAVADLVRSALDAAWDVFVQLRMDLDR